MKKRISQFLLICTIGAFSNLSYGQKCKTVEIRQQNIASHPQLQDRINEINAFTEDFVANYSGNEKAVVTIPVVVHVIWNIASENINDAQIQSQIAVLNKDFRKQNTDFSSTPSPFQSIAADAEFQFCLASKDPNGNATTGITRTQTSDNSIGSGNGYYSTSQGGHDAWDVSKYLNIWVCNPGPGILGFATPPGVAWPANSDGLVIGPNYFGTSGTAANSYPNNLGRTATHEIGHYLNLEHVWGPGSGGCSEDDYVSDTPNQASENYGCPSFPHTDACTSSGNGVNFSNYLDYVDDACMTMFTVGQKARMQACINGPRASLKTSDGCGTGSSTSGIEEVLASGNILEIYPNPAKEQLTISIAQPDNHSTLNIRLTDLLGKTYMIVQVTGKQTIDVSQLPAGIYFVRCEDYPMATKRIMITK